MSFNNHQGKVLNSTTHRWIKISGLTYNNLISNGYIHCGNEMIQVEIAEQEKIYKDITLSCLRLRNANIKIAKLETQLSYKTEIIEELAFHPVFVNKLFEEHEVEDAFEILGY